MTATTKTPPMKTGGQHLPEIEQAKTLLGERCAFWRECSVNSPIKEQISQELESQHRADMMAQDVKNELQSMIIATLLTDFHSTLSYTKMNKAVWQITLACYEEGREMTDEERKEVAAHAERFADLFRREKILPYSPKNCGYIHCGRVKEAREEGRQEAMKEIAATA